MKIVSILLLPFSWIYGVIVWIRNWCYDHNVAHIDHVDVPVISVGNVTTGGSGKTPFVEMLVRLLFTKGLNVAVVSRGYKRASTGSVVVSDGNGAVAGVMDSGDEPYQIARKFPRAVVIVDERRARAAALAVKKFDADVIIMDDGFQHRSLHRDLDIVMVHGGTPPSSLRLLPAGLLREPLSSLARVSLIALSCFEHSGMQAKEFEKYSGAEVIKVHHNPIRLVSPDGVRTVQLSEAKGKNSIAFCGIGSPQSFRRTLDEVGVKIKDFIIFPDHHRGTTSDLLALEESVRRHDPDLIIMTEKDAVFWRPFIAEISLSARGSLVDASSLIASRLYYLEIEMEVIEGSEILRHVIDAKLRKVA